MKRTVLLIAALAALSVARAEPPAGATISDVLVHGNHGLESKKILEETGLKTGEVYKPGDELLAARLVKAFYQRSGFLEAQVKGSTEAAPGVVRIDLTVEEGPAYHFGDTRVEGLRSLPERLIRIEGTYKPGDPYVRSKLFEMQSNLYAKGFFESVEISASTTTERVADVVVRVKERPLKWVKGGVGWGSEERERLTLILLHENLFHRAYRAELTGTWSAIWSENRLDFVNPYFFETRTEQRTSFSWRKENREGYEFERTRGEAGLGRDLTKSIRGSVSVRLDRNIVYDVSPAVLETTPERSDSRTLALALNRDTSNDFFFPSRGTRTALSLERFGGFLGGIINMNRATLDSNFYQTLGGDWVLAFAVRTGVSNPYGPSDEVPVFERFFMGGANSVRGYDERGVGPQDVEGAPLGGTRRLGSSAEVRFPLPWKFRGAVFVDGGQVAQNWRGVDVKEWKYSAGGGLRLITPVGPFRLDAGYKLNRDKGDLELWRLHFSVGEAF